LAGAALPLLILAIVGGDTPERPQVRRAAGPRNQP
jgi:hypothetical protein